MKIGFIGCGNMASAMIGGILEKGICSKQEIIVSTGLWKVTREAKKNLGVNVTLDNCQVVRETKTVILAVKPQFYEEVIAQVKA